MNCNDYFHPHTRRHFLARTGYGLGTAALGSLLSSSNAGELHFAAKAKRVIFLFQSGGPSHLDLFDHKPDLGAQFDKDLPDSVRQGQRITGMVSGQTRLPVQPTRYAFSQAGESGNWFSELLPHTKGVGDELCVVRSMFTEAINHDPAITFMQSGSQLPGRPSMGAWLDYGLGSVNENLPAFVVMNSLPSNGNADQGLLSRLWGSGFLPANIRVCNFAPPAIPYSTSTIPPA